MGDAQVFSLSGRLDSESVPEFERLLLQEMRGETKTLILNLSSLEYLSSAGMRTILSVGKSLQGKDGKLVLCVPKGPTRQIVEVVGFHKMFPMCYDMAEASKHAGGTFKLHMHREYDVDVMTVFGRVDAERAPEIEAAGRKILETPYQKLLINMSAVPYLSSAGLSTLLTLGKVATATHGRLFLCSPSAPVKLILKLSGFDNILTIRNSVQDALVE